MTKENKEKLLKRSFVNRNLVTIVMIPSLIAIHWGWHLMQQNDVFVKKEERVDLPIVTAGKFLWRKITGEIDEGTGTTDK